MNAIRRWSVALAVIVLSAGLVACPGNVPPGGGLSPDRGTDGHPADGLAVLDGARDVGFDRPLADGAQDVTVPDSKQASDTLPADLPGPDLPPAPPCVEKPDNQTVALYTFEKLTGGTTENVASNKHDGTLRDTVGQTTGHGGCGKAALFTGNGYIEVPNAKAFELKAGSVDFWVRFEQPGQAGMISRDAGGTNDPGHLTIRRMCDGGLQARLQRNGKNFFRCTQPVPDNTWMHVALNFGPKLELYLNGNLGSRTGLVTCMGPPDECGSNGVISAGIDGNKNPWVIGASSNASDDGKATPTNHPLKGAMDSVRISNVPRNFKAP